VASANGGCQFYRNFATGSPRLRFDAVSGLPTIAITTTGAAMADLDGDGDEDLSISTGNTAYLLENVATIGAGVTPSYVQRASFAVGEFGFGAGAGVVIFDADNGKVMWSWSTTLTLHPRRRLRVFVSFLPSYILQLCCQQTLWWCLLGQMETQTCSSPTPSTPCCC
jgi:hypothetical protein